MVKPRPIAQSIFLLAAILALMPTAVVGPNEKALPPVPPPVPEKDAKEKELPELPVEAGKATVNGGQVSWAMGMGDYLKKAKDLVADAKDLASKKFGEITNEMQTKLEQLTSGMTSLPRFIAEQITAGGKEKVEQFVNAYKVPNNLIYLREMAGGVFTKNSTLHIKDILLSNFKMAHIFPTPTFGAGGVNSFELTIPDLSINIDVTLDLWAKIFKEHCSLPDLYSRSIGSSDPASVLPTRGGPPPKDMEYVTVEWPIGWAAPKGHLALKLTGMKMNLDARFVLVRKEDAATAHLEPIVLLDKPVPKETLKDKAKKFKRLFMKATKIEKLELEKQFKEDMKPIVPIGDLKPLPLEPAVLNHEASGAMEGLHKRDPKTGKLIAEKTTVHPHDHSDPKPEVRVVLVPTSDCSGTATEFEILLENFMGIAEWATRRKWVRKKVHEAVVNSVLKNTICNTVTGVLNGVLLRFQETIPLVKSHLIKKYELTLDDAPKEADDPSVVDAKAPDESKNKVVVADEPSKEKDAGLEGIKKVPPSASSKDQKKTADTKKS